jgi:uncharacterized membrane protein
MLFDRYARWGLAKKKPTLESVLEIKKLSEDDIVKAKKFLAEVFHGFNLNDFVLLITNWVNYYQGDDRDNIKVAHLRFQKKSNKALNLLGEHVSFLLDLNHLQVIGLTKMELINMEKTYLTHQEALNGAIQFLKKHAPDLMPENAECVTIGHKKEGTKMTFKEPLKFGNIELHWIGAHDEKVVIEGKKKKIRGMKVKMYIPESDLWAWVIVDNQGNIQTFERNVFWNFSAFQRETQMWLHDQWLKEHILL